MACCLEQWSEIELVLLRAGLMADLRVDQRECWWMDWRMVSMSEQKTAVGLADLLAALKVRMLVG